MTLLINDTTATKALSATSFCFTESSLLPLLSADSFWFSGISDSSWLFSFRLEFRHWQVWSLDVAIEEDLVECCTTQSVRTQNQIRVVGSPEVSFPSVPKKLGVRVIASYQKTQLFPKAQFSSLQVISAHFLVLGFYAILSYFSRVFLAWFFTRGPK